MNWKRIVVFVALRLIPITLVTVVVRIYLKPLVDTGQSAPLWLLPASIIVNIGVSIGVFALLAYLQRERTFAHVAIVAFLSWLLSYPLDVLYVRVVLWVWAIGLLFVLIYAAIGAGIGVLLRRSDRLEEANRDFPPSI